MYLHLFASSCSRLLHFLCKTSSKTNCCAKFSLRFFVLLLFVFIKYKMNPFRECFGFERCTIFDTHDIFEKSSEYFIYIYILEKFHLFYTLFCYLSFGDSLFLFSLSLSHSIFFFLGFMKYFAFSASFVTLI